VKSSLKFIYADLKLKQWNKALDDCEAVLAIEPTNLKGSSLLYLSYLTNTVSVIKLII